jgi:hypothetical protein
VTNRDYKRFRQGIDIDKQSITLSFSSVSLCGHIFNVHLLSVQSVKSVDKPNLVNPVNRVKIFRSSGLRTTVSGLRPILLTADCSLLTVFSLRLAVFA